MWSLEIKAKMTNTTSLLCFLGPVMVVMEDVHNIRCGLGTYACFCKTATSTTWDFPQISTLALPSIQHHCSLSDSLPMDPGYVVKLGNPVLIPLVGLPH